MKVNLLSQYQKDELEDFKNELYELFPFDEDDLEIVSLRDGNDIDIFYYLKISLTFEGNQIHVGYLYTDNIHELYIYDEAEQRYDDPPQKDHLMVSSQKFSDARQKVLTFLTKRFVQYSFSTFLINDVEEGKAELKSYVDNKLIDSAYLTKLMKDKCETNFNRITQAVGTVSTGEELILYLVELGADENVAREFGPPAVKKHFETIDLHRKLTQDLHRDHELAISPVPHKHKL